MGGRINVSRPVRPKPSICHNRILQGEVRRRSGGDSTGRRHARLRRRLPAGGHAAVKLRLPIRGRTPNCVVKLIANGQQSTDSFGAERLTINRTGFGCPVNPHPRVANMQQPGAGKAGTLTKGLPRRGSVSGSTDRRGSVDWLCGQGTRKIG